MSEELSNMCKKFSLMVDEAKGIAIENAFCGRDEQEVQLLSSWKSYAESGSK